MRAKGLLAFLFVAALGVNVSMAQVFQLPTAVPQVTAAAADWQVNGDPIFYAGDFYYPTGPTVFFDGFAMVRVGTFKAVPLYADSTLEPYSVVFVPIGRNVMRPYEKRRTGELAGTTGSRASSMLPATPFEPSPTGVEPQVIPEAPRPVATSGAAVSVPRPVGTGGSIVTPSTGATGTAVINRGSNARRSALETIPPPRGTSGVWLEFNGARWYSAGPAVTYRPERFVTIGTHRGFPVYQVRNGSPNTIYIPSVQDGPLAPFRR